MQILIANLRAFKGDMPKAIAFAAVVIDIPERLAALKRWQAEQEAQLARDRAEAEWTLAQQSAERDFELKQQQMLMRATTDAGIAQNREGGRLDA